MRDGVVVGGASAGDCAVGGPVSEGVAGREVGDCGSVVPGQRVYRDHARRALRRAAAGPPGPRKPRVPVVRFGPEVPEVIEALRLCWAVLDGPSGKRLAAALPRLVGALRAHGELVIDDRTAGLLCSMSGAPIDRPVLLHAVCHRWSIPGFMHTSFCVTGVHSGVKSSVVLGLGFRGWTAP